MSKEINNDKIAGIILSTYGIRVKSTDEIIPFYGLLMDMEQKIAALNEKENKTTSLTFQTEKQAFWYGCGKWLNLTLCIAILSIGVTSYIKTNRITLPDRFMKNSVLVTTKTKEGKSVTGYLLNKGEKENYQAGKHYLVGKNDGTIIVPLE